MHLTKRKFFIYAILVLSFIGVFDAVYLTAYHYKTLRLPCTLTQGCDTVLQSSYAKVFGVPVALFGVLYYAVVFVLIIVFMRMREWQERAASYLVYITFAGFLFSLYLTYLQFFVIRSFCQYCLLSGLLTTLLFISSLLLQKTTRAQAQETHGKESNPQPLR